MYWATTAEIRFPIPFVPDDLGISGAVFADAGSLWNAGGSAQTLLRIVRPSTAQACLAGQLVHPLVGRRQLDVGLAGRPDPYGFRQGSQQRDLRRRAVLPLRRGDEVLIAAAFGAKKASVRVAERRPRVAFAATMERRPSGGYQAWSIPDSSNGPGRSRLADVAKATGAELAPGCRRRGHHDRGRAHPHGRGPARPHLLQ